MPVSNSIHDLHFALCHLPHMGVANLVGLPKAIYHRVHGEHRDFLFFFSVVSGVLAHPFSHSSQEV